MTFLFTSESVSFGHPDKVADQISDLLLDYFLLHHKESKVAIETMIARNKVIIGGEVSVSFDKKVLEDEIKNFLIKTRVVPYLADNIEQLEIIILLDMQSKEISNLVVHEDKTIGAGDQGIMYGYANLDTEEYMPAPIYYAKKILDSVLSNFSYLGPDAKSQVAVRYDNERNPIKIEKILLSVQHPESIFYKDLKDLILETIKNSCSKRYLIDNETEIIVNPAGSFINGGPFADTGLTGRKIIVDTYGGFAPHGGGAFSGKDPTKVDRSASYMTRYLAKNIVAAGFAKEAIVQIAYTIGIEQPFSFSINTRGTGIVSDNVLRDMIVELVDLSPKAIINYLDLWKPIYFDTARNGHFGVREFAWEKLGLVERIKDFYQIRYKKPKYEENSINYIS